MVRVSDIHKKYGHNTILDGAGIEAEPGQTVAIVGRNGCGKTTLLQIIAGSLKPDSGSVNLFGRDALKDRKVFGRFVGYVPQDDPLIGSLSVRDNLKFWASGVKEPDKSVIQSFDLEDMMDKRVDTLSGGMRRRLSIACAIERKTPVLILDEPTTSLDIGYQDIIREWMKEYAGSKGTIIMSTHNMQEIAQADKVYILNAGRTECMENGAIDPEEISRIFRISD